jgi:ubiquinone/menaquinone biosynthesis C-methylase UbiE
VSFDRIAPHYHWLDTIAFGNKLQTARVAFLDQIDPPKRALVAGEGNGRFLRQLLRKYPATKVDCADASARMLQLARERAPSEGSRVRFLHKDLLAWSPEKAAYDLIVTHFFFDCFTENEIETIAQKLARSAKQNAIWLLADFFIPARVFTRLHALASLQAMYWFFRATTRITARRLIDPSESLRRHNFHLVTRRSWRFGLIKSELWQR